MKGPGSVPRDGTRERVPMLDGRSSSDSDVEGRPIDSLLSGSAKLENNGAYSRPSGRRRSFKWIMGFTCLSMLALMILIFFHFSNAQFKAQPSDSHKEGGSQADQQINTPSSASSTPEVNTTMAPTPSSSVNPTKTPQAKLTPAEEFDLKTGFQVSNTTTIREYVFNITRELRSPDGFEKSMILVNGQSPGPLIEANTGDTIRVTVHNHMLQESTTIHWHGIDQRNSVWMDGVHGVTQCAIPAGESFTYEFNVTDQRGTFWWHAHVTVQVTDGLFGPLIIHDLDEKIPSVDDDKIVMVGDLFHEDAETLLNQYLSANPPWSPKKPGREPPPPNLIINGQSTFNCSSIGDTGSSGTSGQADHNVQGHHMPGHDMTAPHNSARNPAAKCTGGSMYNTRVKSGSKTRLRLINHGTSTPIFVTIDGHALEIVEIDGVEVAPLATSRVYMNPGQRYSVIVHANQTAGNYLIRADAAVKCFHMSHKNHESMHGKPFGAKAILSYDATDASVSPIGNAWDLTSKSNPGIGNEPWGNHCEDLVFNLPKPVRSRPAYTVGEGNHHYFTFRLDLVGDVMRTHVNGTLFTPLKDDASLWKVSPPNMSPLNPRPAHAQLDLGKDQIVLLSQDSNAAQIVVNSDTMMVHPWHLHGQNFQVIGQGKGLFGQGQTTWNFDNPMRRDTMTIPGFSHVVIRILADNPGIWAFHCHYLWHAEGGMFVSIAQRMDDLAKMLGSLDATGDAASIKRKFCAAPNPNPNPNPPAVPPRREVIST